MEIYANWLQEKLSGAQLQTIRSTENLLQLLFYKHQEFSLVFDLNKPQPTVVLIEGDWRPTKASPKPVAVFLNAHAKNLRLQNISARTDLGRVIELELISGKSANVSEEDTLPCEIQAVLIPKMPNLFVSSGNKKISWNKPRDLPLGQLSPEPAADFSPEDYGSFWLNAQHSPHVATGKNPTIDKDKLITKKLKAIQDIEAGVSLEKENLWRQMGEALKQITNETSGQEWSELYDKTLSKSQNREKAFVEAKALVKKREGAEKRILDLKNEIEKLQATPTENTKNSLTGKSAASDAAKGGRALQVLKKYEARGRTLRFTDDADGGFEAVIGKSGEDNLKILRAASSWDYWMHLKDYPGSHAVLFRNKNQNIPRSIVDQLAQKLIESSVKQHHGLKFSVVMAECRFVKPVKGAKAGLVTYQNATVFTVASAP